MKKILFAVMATALTASVPSSAQPALCPGSGFNQPDNAWYTSACPGGVPPSYIENINTAMIDFPGAAQPKIPRGSLLASVYRGNGTAGGVSFRDMNSGFTVTIPYCTTGDYIDRAGDIILGNDPAQPLTAFRAAVVFYNLVTGLPQINYYRISYTSAVNFTVLFTGSTTFNPPAPGDWIGSISHIDVIADYSNTALTGFPWCDEFVVTWDDLPAGTCWAHKASLSAPPLVVTVAWPTVMLPSSGSGAKPGQPDVAAIQRLNALGGLDQIGLFAMNQANEVSYVEYNWNTMLFSTVTSHPTPTGISTPANWPRIDAPDDYNINSPATPGLCYYKIATQITTGIGATSRVYDNTFPSGFFGQDDGAAVYGGMGLYNIGIFTPTVAYGGNGGQQYQVLHYMDAGAALPGATPGVYMEPINWMWPASATIPDLYGANRWFYRVNTANPTFCNGRVLNAISTPCNNPSSSTLCAWADFNGGTGLSTVYYKITGYGGPSGYTFKPGGEETAAISTSWRVYPIPAAASLTVESPESGSYTIADVLGRTVLEGSLQEGAQSIDINGLAPSSYIISRYANGRRTDHSTFIKQ